MDIAEALSTTPVSSVDLTRFVAVSPDSEVSETVSLMSAADRSCACVIDDDRVIGTFTQRDYVQRVIGHRHSWERPVSDEMTTPVQTMPNTGSVADGLAIMNEWWIRSVPVVEESGRFVGNLSFYAVMATIHNLLASRVSTGVGEATVHHGLTLVDFTGLNMSAPMICRADDPVDVAVHQMRARGVGSILVTDERENLVGELTEFDLLTKVGCSDVVLSAMSVADVMQPKPVSLPVRSSIADGLDELLRGSVSHIPLVAESGKPVGVASVRDIAHYIETTLETLG